MLSLRTKFTSRTCPKLVSNGLAVASAKKLHVEVFFSISHRSHFFAEAALPKSSKMPDVFRLPRLLLGPTSLYLVAYDHHPKVAG